ncbi:hypothetical protein D3C84_1006680 [compost metagenome]
MRLASAEDEQIERQHGKDEHYEGGPHPGLADADGGHLLSPHEAEIGWRSHANEPFTSTKIVYSLRIVRFLRSIDSGYEPQVRSMACANNPASYSISMNGLLHRSNVCKLISR